MPDSFSQNPVNPEVLSAMVDGEAHPHEFDGACSAWKDQPDLRATWHTYHLIGDVMRSEDLALTSPGGAFLQGFRARLAQEPVVLAPTSSSRGSNVNHPAQAVQPVALPLRRRTWAGPMAVAAGFVMVVGALLAGQTVPNGSASMADASLAFAPRQMAVGTWGIVDSASVRSEGLMALGASFSQPDSAVLTRGTQVDPMLPDHLAAPRGDGSFAGQGTLTSPFVLAGR